jgi:hypothetical protein
LPTPRGSEEDHVLGTLDEGETPQLHDLLARCAGSAVEVVLIERLDRGEAGHSRKHLARPRPTRLALGDQQLLQEVGERGALLGRGLRQRRILRRDPAEPQLVAQINQAFVLHADATSTAGISSSYTRSGCW